GFKDSFPELYSLLGDLNDLSFSQADRFLDSQRRRQAPPIELFGARFPGEAVAGLGTCILVMCQLYFLAQLGRLAKSLVSQRPDEWPDGYLATYPNRLSFSLAVGTAVVVPPLTLVWQSLAEVSRAHWRTATLILGVPLSEASAPMWLLFA